MPGFLRVSMVPLLAVAVLTQQRIVTIDAFESTSGWSRRTSDGVTLRLSSDSGYRGRSMRLDFDFGASTGVAVARRAINITVPPNFELAFRARAVNLPADIHLRLLDQSGESVLSATPPALDSVRAWTEIVLRKRQFVARGPKPGEVGRVAAIELAITAGATGGRGTIWIDDLQLHPREPDRPYTLTPRLVSSSNAVGFEPLRAMDGDSASGWRSGIRDSAPPPPPPPPP